MEQLANGLRYGLRVRLSKGEPFYGPGVAELLARVERTGSLQTAAAAMGMSYSKAWKITRAAEAALGYPLLERRAGGAGGGFSRLTERGRAFAGRYERFCEALEKEADRLFWEYFGGEADEEDQNG